MFELLEDVPQLMNPGGFRVENMDWNMIPRLFKRTPGLPTLIVKPMVWDKWCKEPCTQWEPTQLARDFWPRVALVICYLKFQDLPEDKLWDQMVVSMTLAYVPEHWQLVSFQESSYMINMARTHGDPQGMISLTRVHKKAPFLPDVSYQEYSQHMTIAPLIPPDDEGLDLCGPPPDFAVGAFHCKSQGSGKSGKLIFQAAGIARPTLDWSQGILEPQKPVWKPAAGDAPATPHQTLKSVVKTLEKPAPAEPATCAKIKPFNQARPFRTSLLRQREGPGYCRKAAGNCWNGPGSRLMVSW